MGSNTDYLNLEPGAMHCAALVKLDFALRCAVLGARGLRSFMALWLRAAYLQDTRCALPWDAVPMYD